MFTVRADVGGLAPGEQVCISYGDRSNEVCVVSHPCVFVSLMNYYHTTV